MRSLAYTLTAVMIYLATIVAGCTARTEPAPASAPETAPAPAPASGWEPEWKTVVEAARKEGTISVYTTWIVDVHGALSKKFREDYGLNVEFTSMGRGLELVARLQREQLAGLYLADVIGGASDSVRSVTEPKALVAPIEPMLILPEAKDASVRVGGRVFIDTEQKYVIPLSATFDPYMVRNTELVRDGEIKSFSDLLDPKWRGKVVLSDPTLGAGSGVLAINLLANQWGLDKTKDFLRQLVKQEPVIGRDYGLMAEWLARGKYPLGIGLEMGRVLTFKKMGAPVTVVRTTEGGLISSGPGAITLPAGKIPHPNAARVFINWLQTREGQTEFSRAISAPAWRLDVSTQGLEDLAYIPGQPFKIADEELKRYNDVLKDVTKEILAPLLR
ncbi:MAG: extracellular solute-binding protein [Chloroflexi bacterium]|nr:extracellular solute-binding protein [Chloroflexota bacterium]